MSELDAAIRQTRSTEAELTLTHGDAPLANREVVVAQRRHKFLLGANWGKRNMAYFNDALSGEDKTLAEQRNAHFLALFNQVTLPFYWARFEAERGKPDTERLTKMAQFYKDNGCTIKGHPLCWHTLAPDWLLEMPNEDIIEAVDARIQHDVAAFAGLVDLWDVVNEAVIMPVYDRYDNGITRICKEMGRVELLRRSFETARQSNPDATLVLNDFDLTTAYDVLIESCLTAGIPIDVLGLQTHMHQGFRGVEWTQRVLERFSRFGLPLHFTEVTLVSGDLMPPEIGDLNDWQPDDWPSTPEGEARQVEELLLFYKTLLAHPAVEAITWWDVSDGGWLNAPAGLLRRDETPKPAYDELLKLVKGEWWLKPTTMTTDAEGKLRFDAFFGDYEITLDGQTTAFAIDTPGAVALSI